MPQQVIDTQPEGMEWIIEGDGRARYKFALVPINRIVPNRELASIKVPDATPEIIGAYALNDEQALLARVRYNRLIDVFLGVTAYSLQSHMRTSVAGIGQIEIEVSAQFMEDDRMAMFELTVQDGRVCVVDEKHYLLVPAESISPEELRAYRR